MHANAVDSGVMVLPIHAQVPPIKKATAGGL
jgi:hypothetical protein